MITKENVKDELFNVRVALDLTQEELSKKCGVSRITLNRLENGRIDKDNIRANTLFKINKFLKTQNIA